MRHSILYILLFSSLGIFAQKKDRQAWKAEKSIEAQFATLKKNANYWSEYFMFKEAEINDFQKSLSDSISTLESEIKIQSQKESELKQKIESLSLQFTKTQTKLETSLTKENNLYTLGTEFDKNSFPGLMYAILIIFLITALIGFGLFFRSNIVTRETLKNYESLTEELANQKKRSLERETKLNRELQTERNKNNK